MLRCLVMSCCSCLLLTNFVTVSGVTLGSWVSPFSVLRAVFTDTDPVFIPRSEFIRFLVWDRSCPKIDGLRPHHWIEHFGLSVGLEEKVLQVFQDFCRNLLTNLVRDSNQFAVLKLFFRQHSAPHANQPQSKGYLVMFLDHTERCPTNFFVILSLPCTSHNVLEMQNIGLGVER